MPYHTPLATTESKKLAALEEIAARNVSTCGDTPTIIARHGPAGNDATISEDDGEPWALHASAANGFGHVATNDSTSSVRPTSYEVHCAGRAYRSFILGEIIVAAIRTVAATARRAYARLLQRRRSRAIYDALRELDDRTLHDIGFERSEIGSVAAEMTRKAEQTRLRATTLDETPDPRYWTA
jgi:uncharacterized protein YjiS (DUF1127 family)